MVVDKNYKQVFYNISIVGNHLLKGQFSTLYKKFLKHVNSEKLYFGLKRDLHKEIKCPKAKINITVRPFEIRDSEFLLSTNGLTGEVTKQVEHQRKLVNSNLATCYVAVDAEDKPCYMQWLIGPVDNDKIISVFKGLFPRLNANEALLEGAFMHHSYRGLGVMPDAMCQIAEKALDIGASEVITFVGVNNVPSLKGCKSCGFSPYILLREKWFLFTKSVTLEPIPEDVFAKYETNTAYKLQKV